VVAYVDNMAITLSDLKVNKESDLEERYAETTKVNPDRPKKECKALVSLAFINIYNFIIDTPCGLCRRIRCT